MRKAVAGFDVKGIAIITVVVGAFAGAVVYLFNQQGGSLPSEPTHISVSVSPHGDLLCFSAVGEGGSDLYLYDLRTKRVTRFTKTPAHEIDPCFSPNGRDILYAAQPPGSRGSRLFMRQVQHPSVVKQLTADDYNDYQPSFSPDGSKIVFIRDQQYRADAFSVPPWSQPDVYVVHADGTHLQRGTNSPDSWMNAPQFLADNKTVVYSADSKDTAESSANGTKTSRWRIHHTHFKRESKRPADPNPHF